MKCDPNIRVRFDFLSSRWRHWFHAKRMQMSPKCRINRLSTLRLKCHNRNIILLKCNWPIGRCSFLNIQMSRPTPVIFSIFFPQNIADRWQTMNRIVTVNSAQRKCSVTLESRWLLSLVSTGPIIWEIGGNNPHQPPIGG